MRIKNTMKFIQFKYKKIMPQNFKKIRIIFFSCCLLLCFCSCKKLELLTGNKSAMEQFFAENVLSRDFVVDYASADGTDITSKYKGYTFVLLKGEGYYAGKLTGLKDGITTTGTWSTTEDFSQLVINLTTPTIPTEFIFLNRTWKFTKKIPPVLQLAPYGTVEDKVLYMRRL